MHSVVINKATLLKILHKHSNEIKSFGVESLGIFGSFVRDTATMNSDIDLLVEFKQGQKSYDNFMDLSFYLEALLGRKVELLTPQSLNKYIGPHILNQVEHVGL